MLGEEAGLAAHRSLWKLQLREAKRDAATHIIILGDVFDTPFPDQERLLLVTAALAAARDFHVIVMLGNHDVHDAAHNSLRLLSKMPGFGALTHVKFVTQEPELVKWDGLRVLVQPWGTKLPNERPAHDLIVFHDTVVGAKVDSGRLVSVGEGLKPESFGDELAIGGDIHTPQRLGNVTFAGTAAQMTFGEKPDKRMLLFTKSGNDCKLSSRRITPPWLLETVLYKGDKLPTCDAPNTYYRLILSDESLPSKWLVQHPQVVKVEGRKKEGAQTVTLVENLVVEDDNVMMARWLREHSPLDAFGRMQAMKLHKQLSRKT